MACRLATHDIFPPATSDAQLGELLSSGHCRLNAFIKSVRFSQGGVHPGFSSGVLLREAAMEFREQGWNSELPCIRCVLFLGRGTATLISWDNRRLTMLRYLHDIGQMDTVLFHVFLAESCIPDEMKEQDVTLQFPVFKAPVPGSVVDSFAERLRVDDGGVKDFRTSGFSEGYKPRTWGQMIFHRTFSQSCFGSMDFPIDGTLRPPISALDREQVYSEYCVELIEFIEKTKAEAEARGEKPTWRPKGFDFAGNPTIFDRRKLESLNELLVGLTREQLLKRVPYMAEWCSQVYENNGFVIPPTYVQLLAADEVASGIKPEQKFLSACISDGRMFFEFEGASRLCLAMSKDLASKEQLTQNGSASTIQVSEQAPQTHRDEVSPRRRDFVRRSMSMPQDVVAECD
jgi:hypothetical protein